jgi:hypothetical protein
MAAVGLATLFALAPAPWIAWVNDVSFIVRLPTIPFGHAASLIGERGASSENPERVAMLRAEVDRFRVLYEGARTRAESLQEQLDQIQRARSEAFDVPSRLITATIVGRGSAGPSDSLTLNRGSSRGVVEGAIAVFDGSHLVGRVGDVRASIATLIPITDPSIDIIEAYLAPSDPADPRSITRRARTLLEPNGDGTLRGDVPSEAEPRVDDYVLLDDPRWPPTARSMIVGRVTSVTPRDENPLFHAIVVKPVYAPARLAFVTIKVEDDGGSADGAVSGAGEGGS